MLTIWKAHISYGLMETQKQNVTVCNTSATYQGDPKTKRYSLQHVCNIPGRPKTKRYSLQHVCNLLWHSHNSSETINSQASRLSPQNLAYLYVSTVDIQKQRWGEYANTAASREKGSVTASPFTQPIAEVHPRAGR